MKNEIKTREGNTKPGVNIELETKFGVGNLTRRRKLNPEKELNLKKETKPEERTKPGQGNYTLRRK